ncbi:TolC family protein [Selenomonas sp. TAMA-11512]|uniref:TolC family protein n=1 Tax=Selenomonas sp. TAMA-11512 TaxID=3095337 RepID=UPI00308823B9|nr:TolC family protein [Selenomonas sp. TAMA-11512]
MKKWRGKRWALLLAGLCCWRLTGAEAADLSLDQAVRLSIEDNTGQKITEESEVRRAAELDEARRSKGVSVTAGASANTSKTWSEGSSNHNSNASSSANLNASMPLINKSNDKNIDSAELALDTARLAAERAREDLRLSVVEAYYDALQARDTIAVNRESLSNLEKHLSNTEILYQAGSKARMDVLRAAVEVSNAKQTLISSESSYEVSLANLRNLTNIDRDEPLTLTTSVAYVPFLEELDDVLSYGQRMRKDLQSDSIAVERAKVSLDLVKAAYHPTLSLSVGTNGGWNYRPSNDHNHGVSAGLNLNWNIFDNGQREAKLRAAESDIKTAELTLQKDRETVDYSIREAYHNMRAAERKQEATRDAVGLAREERYIASEKYRVGEGIMLDIIDAELALSRAELNYIEAQYSYARYRAQIENRMGKPLDELPAAASPAEASAADERRVTTQPTGEKDAAQEARDAGRSA